MFTTLLSMVNFSQVSYSYWTVVYLDYSEYFLLFFSQVKYLIGSLTVILLEVEIFKVEHNRQLVYVYRDTLYSAKT